MRSFVWLRIAAGLTLVFAALHTRGFPWTPIKDIDAQAVAEAMQNVHFTVLGEVRSYADFYVGFGLCIGAFLCFSAVTMWQMGTLAKRGVGGLAPMNAGVTLLYLAQAVVAFKYIFAPPLLLSLLIVLCLGVAMVCERRQAAPSEE